jgi:hypothetical protein
VAGGRQRAWKTAGGLQAPGGQRLDPGRGPRPREAGTVTPAAARAARPARRPSEGGRRGAGCPEGASTGGGPEGALGAAGTSRLAQRQGAGGWGTPGGPPAPGACPGLEDQGPQGPPGAPPAPTHRHPHLFAQRAPRGEGSRTLGFPSRFLMAEHPAGQAGRGWTTRPFTTPWSEGAPFDGRLSPGEWIALPPIYRGELSTPTQVVKSFRINRLTRSEVDRLNFIHPIHPHPGHPGAPARGGCGPPPGGPRPPCGAS